MIAVIPSTEKEGKNMRAIVTDGTTLAVHELPTPEPGAGEVRVAVRAATVNPVDALWASGFLHQNGIAPAGAWIGLGWDAVGVVDAVGEGVSGVRVGDLVAGTHTTFGTPTGALADSIVLPADHVTPVPDGLTAVEAASIGMNSLTAAQALDLLGPAAGRTLLVTGAAGALGGFVLELAVRAGWEVTGLARDTDTDFVKSRGAALVTALDGATYDAVVDAAALQEAVLPAIAPGGDVVGVVSIVPLPDGPDRTVHTVSVVPDGPRLSELLQLAVDGVLTPRVLGTVPLTEAADAILASGSGGRRGRYVAVLD